MDQKDGKFNAAISAITYGFNCLVLGPNGQLYECVISIHQQYINILHLLIAKKASYLLKLHEIYNISDSQYTIQTTLKAKGIYNYIILYTQSLQTFTFAVKTQYQKHLLKIALVLMIRQAKIYYDRLNQFDPFKAEAMMTFLHADKDGGNLLDIEQIQNILNEMKIIKQNKQIIQDIKEINQYLYQKQKLRKPKDLSNSELSELGFQYLLRFYSIKDDLAKYFSSYCPMFKLKVRGLKHYIVDCVRNCQKPIMSASQLRQFYIKILFQDVTQEFCSQLIQSFPVYDGQGKQKQEQSNMISFNNFCSLISSRKNSFFPQQKKLIYQNMNLPLSDYFIYTQINNYLLYNQKSSTKINHYELSLKRGCRCLQIGIKSDKNNNPIVFTGKDNYINLQQILKVISVKAFEFNCYPLILQIIIEQLNKQILDKIAKLFVQILQDMLYTLPHNFTEYQNLPSPDQLNKKILIMANVNSKLLKSKQKDFPEQSFQFFKIVSLFSCKIDFDRRGQNCWNFCNLQMQKIKKYEQVQPQNISNYTQKISVKTNLEKLSNINQNCIIPLRLGIQMIGLSFISTNEQNYIMQSLFLQNGGSKSGFVCKPNWMCIKNTKTSYSKNYQTPLFILSIKIVSGQNCIINNVGDQRYFVQVFIRGNKKQQEVNKIFTSSAQNAGYYIKYGFQCQFKIYCIDIAMLVVIIRGQKSKKIAAGRAIPLRHMKQGLRPIFLMGQNFKQAINSYLFIFSQRKQPPKKQANYLDLKL